MEDKIKNVKKKARTHTLDIYNKTTDIENLQLPIIKQITLNLLHLTMTFKESKPSKVEEAIVKNLVPSSHL